jgi:uncharacterized membrane protein YphA (DoxX/SURF4 family)
MGETLQRARRWIEANRDLWLDLLRIYIGIALFVKGVAFMNNSSALLEAMYANDVPFASLALGHYVAMAHLAGGLMLAVGLLTRLAALVQVPILVGAVLFVHGREGFFTAGQTLELALLVLFVLVLFVVNGAGRLSADHLLARSARREEARRERLRV